MGKCHPKGACLWSRLCSACKVILLMPTANRDCMRHKSFPRSSQDHVGKVPDATKKYGFVKIGTQFQSTEKETHKPPRARATSVSMWNRRRTLTRASGLEMKYRGFILPSSLIPASKFSVRKVTCWVILGCYGIRLARGQPGPIPGTTHVQEPHVHRAKNGPKYYQVWLSNSKQSFQTQTKQGALTSVK